MNISTFEPQNILEQHLAEAATDPSARPQFLETLLRSQIIIVPAADFPQIKDGIVTEGSTISLAALEHDGKRYTPFFTSEARLAPGTRYLSMMARDFLRLTKGSNLVLNPGAAYGKEFLPEEVASLLDGSYTQPREEHVIERSRQVLMGQPAEYPDELLNALSRLYEKHPAVKRAFMALYHDQERDSEPGLLIVLDVDSEAAMRRASAESGIVFSGFKEKFHHIDLTRFDDDGLGSYFINGKIAPFYERAGSGSGERIGWWKKLFGQKN